MKHLRKSLLALVLVIPFIFSSCSKDDGPTVTAVNSKVYDLGTVGTAGVSGKATFIENSDATVSIELELLNTPQGGSHPAHIHLNTAADGGDIALTLKPVDGTTGKSTTTFKTLDNGSAITYQALLDFDGYINVHLSANQLGTLVAQGDIGQNDLTDVSKVYPLGSVADPLISGTATFYKRVNGNALAVIKLNNTPAGGIHPGHIHTKTVAEGDGEIAFTFKPVNGDTGISTTNVSKLDNGTAFGYDQVLMINGYINFHKSADELPVLVAEGDIGQNELTGISKVYPLASVANSTISGTATFYKRVNGQALAVIKLENTPAGGSHPGHIHKNSAAQGGVVAFTFNPVNGDTGISKTNVSKLNDGTAFGYDQVLTYNGYINIHKSLAEINVLVAQGNIGSNVAGTESKTYNVTANGNSSYVFNGEGLNGANNPNLTFKRGGTYTFNMAAAGHPFFINMTNGTGTANAYNSGVTNNGAASGTITFTVPMGAPNTLYYNCQLHGSMFGTITITN
jgi:uncharacterized protein YerC